MNHDLRHVCHGSFLFGASLSLALFCALQSAIADTYAGVIGCVIAGGICTGAAWLFYQQIPRR